MRYINISDESALNNKGVQLTTNNIIYYHEYTNDELIIIPLESTCVIKNLLKDDQQHTYSLSYSYDKTNYSTLAYNQQITISKKIYLTWSFGGASLLVGLLITGKYEVAGSLSNHAANLFKDNTDLIYSHKLILKGNLDANKYCAMFQGCTNMKTCPNLNNITNISSSVLANAFASMFQGCTSLLYGPKIIFSELGDNCFPSMFQNCTSMVRCTNELPSIISDSNCYYQMFKNCKSLKKAPKIKLSYLDSTGYLNCMYSMFYGCASLNKIELYGNDFYQQGEELSDCSFENIFGGFTEFCKNGINLKFGYGILPFEGSGFWAVSSYFDGFSEYDTNQDGEYINISSDLFYNDYFTITVKNITGTYKKLVLNLFPYSWTNCDYYIAYSIDDGKTWKYCYNGADQTYVLIPIEIGDKIKFKGNFKNNKCFINDDEDTYFFIGSQGTLLADIEGNVLSLLFEDNFVGKELNTNLDKKIFDEFFCDEYTGINPNSMKHLFMPFIGKDTCCMKSTLTYTPNLLYFKDPSDWAFDESGSLKYITNLCTIKDNITSVPRTNIRVYKHFSSRISKYYTNNEQKITVGTERLIYYDPRIPMKQEYDNYMM